MRRLQIEEIMVVEKDRSSLCNECLVIKIIRFLYQTRNIQSATGLDKVDKTRVRI